MNNNENEFLDWNSGFVAEENSFTLLPAGEYQFTVTNWERKNYDGNSDKIPNGAPYAEISMEITAPEGKTVVKERLYMMKKFQWKLTEFFASIGQNPMIGQPFNPNWNTVLGSIGRVKLEVNTYTSQGEERKNNRVKEFIKSTAAVAPQQQIFNQPPQQNFNQQPAQQNFNQPTQQTMQQPPQQNNGFTPGAF
ncbi:hypothetical protein [Candidatus Enterococcus clewellii]|uniref:DUF669 domain-containing protein n=1 Tax=Candidatus Enterococcus clewellii TaxID=1834193 RepID=A0A242KAI8_9ENTE|nr:hypothetical protein [Enterococcus sp. 9E7_DIV0242]OTP17560.1 hypothetical protein A5888_001698 [Enterococcus sp. 9E7_DIV0242]